MMADGRTLLLAFQHMSADRHPEYRAFVTRSSDEGVSLIQGDTVIPMILPAAQSYGRSLRQIERASANDSSALG